MNSRWILRSSLLLPVRLAILQFHLMHLFFISSSILNKPLMETFNTSHPVSQCFSPGNDQVDSGCFKQQQCKNWLLLGDYTTNHRCYTLLYILLPFNVVFLIMFHLLSTNHCLDSFYFILTAASPADQPQPVKSLLVQNELRAPLFISGGTLWSVTLSAPPPPLSLWNFFPIFPHFDILN